MDITDVFNKYENIRKKNKMEEQRRREEVYCKIPELKVIHNQIWSLQFERINQTAHGRCFNDDEIVTLRQKASQLLSSSGFNVHYLDPIYTCSICQDTGFQDNAWHCECFIRYRMENLLNEARLIDNSISFEQYDLSIFDETTFQKSKSQRDAMLYCKRITETWADKFPDSSKILLLHGSVGLGKTYTARCIMRRVMEHGYTAAYYTAYRIFSLFHSHRLGENVDLDAIFFVPLLIIDDLGTEPMTRNVTIEYFFDLINERIAANLNTIIVTNLIPDDIDKRYGERIKSRLSDKRYSMAIEFKGNDVRIPKKMN